MNRPPRLQRVYHDVLKGADASVVRIREAARVAASRPREPYMAGESGDPELPAYAILNPHTALRIAAEDASLLERLSILEADARNARDHGGTIFDEEMKRLTGNRSPLVHVEKGMLLLAWAGVLLLAESASLLPVASWIAGEDLGDLVRNGAALGSALAQATAITAAGLLPSIFAERASVNGHRTGAACWWSIHLFSAGAVAWFRSSVMGAMHSLDSGDETILAFQLVLALVNLLSPVAIAHLLLGGAAEIGKALTERQERMALAGRTRAAREELARVEGEIVTGQRRRAQITRELDDAELGRRQRRDAEGAALLAFAQADESWPFEAMATLADVEVVIQHAETVRAARMRRRVQALAYASLCGKASIKAARWCAALPHNLSRWVLGLPESALHFAAGTAVRVWTRLCAMRVQLAEAWHRSRREVQAIRSGSPHRPLTSTSHIREAQ